MKDIGYAKSLRETIANTEVQTHGSSVCSLEPECEGADRLLGVSLEKCRYALRAETRHYDSKGDDRFVTQNNEREPAGKYSF